MLIDMCATVHCTYTTNKQGLLSQTRYTQILLKEDYSDVTVTVGICSES